MFLGLWRVRVESVKGDEFVPVSLVRRVGAEAGTRHGDKIYYECQLGISNKSVECNCRSCCLMFLV